jgi:cell division protein FtsI (penicillin-binding protein 3)
MEFEPGSIFKVVIAAAALEERLVDPKDRFDCENGSIVLAGFTIRDHKPFGLLSFEEIIENSSNVGAIKIGMKLGASNVYKYATKLGIGRKTGIDLNGEGRGYIRPLRKWSGLSIGAVSIGQEVFVTPLQMLRVLAIIANGGYDVKPHVGYKIISPKGLAYYLNDDSVGKEKILSDYTIDNLRGFLRGVVMRGTGKLAELEGYGVSGKTGTAQKIGPSKTYADGGIIASFMGYFPSYNPKVVMLVLIDEPTGVFWGSQIAAPLFSRIARRTAEVLRIPPSEPLLYASVKQKESTAPSDSLNKNYAQIGEAMMRGTIPDFKGLPLEEALMWITEMKIPFKFIGYGKVIAQIPDPGFPISLTNGIIIYLSPEGS